MKILNIRFKNIHSLKGEHQVDFAHGPLADAGLFAITGPTGSGKSSLLDVITLALYNRIARVGKSVSNSLLEDDGGIMTRNARSCFAEVTYAVKGRAYRSHWSIERNRNHNLNNRKQELVDVATGTILHSGTKTPEQNEAIIKLSYEQFVKAMVLSQGEFSKLLQAPRNERNKLLEDLTGARSYRNIGRAVFHRHAAVKKEVELKEAGLQHMALFTDEERRERKAQLTELRQQRKAAAELLEVQRGKREVRAQLGAQEQKHREYAEKAKRLAQMFVDFKVQDTRLARHGQLVKHSDLLRDHELAQKEREKAQAQLQKLRAEEKEIARELGTQLKAIGQAVGKSVGQDNALGVLEKFRKDIVALQAQEREQEGQAQLHLSQLRQMAGKVRELGHALEPKADPAEVKRDLEEITDRVSKIIKDSGVTSSAELEQRLDALRQDLDRAKELKGLKEQYTRLEEQLTRAKKALRTELEKGEKDAMARQQLAQDLEALQQEVALLRKNLEHQRLHQRLEGQRAQLREGQPCPLCGSLEHPYAGSEPHFNADADRLKQMEALLESQNNTHIALQESEKYRNKEMERLKAERQTLGEAQAKVGGEMEQRCRELGWPPTIDLDEMQEKQRALEEQLSFLHRSKGAFSVNALLEEMELIRAAWQLAVEGHAALKLAREKRYKGTDIDAEANRLSQKMTTARTAQEQTLLQLQEAEVQLKKALEAEKDQQAKMQAVLSKEGLANAADLKRAILPEQTAQEYRERKNELQLWKATLDQKQAENREQLNLLREKDDTQRSTEALEVAFLEAKAQSDALGEEFGKISQALANDEQMRQKFEAQQVLLAKLKKDALLWKTMNDLIGDANGNKFSNFVQDLTLEQLIGHANRRLAEFTDRYLLDIPTADEAEKSDTLKILDAYMGNARRSVRTLSGGETFLVSLAMAFALSDIASRNVKIESLFIDEGFGTLDPDTLDQAITILEKMQNEGDRSVGVISHVGALKERITTQIQLEKGSLGHSQVRVVQ
ncbi:AAA family ATPase [Maribacter sp. 2307ULW6-5]|uniref:AAA family ATPase n=1 Tax=Maribacter sp. 2307ULW6-5 TaxID=3386275 RepID=UPI0039BC7FAC